MQVTKDMQAMRASGKTYQQIADHYGVDSTTVSRAFNGRKDRPDSLTAKPKQKGGVLTIDTIISQFNTAEKVMAAIEALPADEFKRDSDIIVIAGITRAGWDKAKRNDKVKACAVRLPDGSFVWGKKHDAAKLRSKLMEV
jgi:uncharacterized protein (DUF433 family)